jgi:hypothetical protein
MASNMALQVLYTVNSESHCALRLRYVDLVVSIEVTAEVCCYFTVFSFKQKLKCNTGKVCNCLIQFLLYRCSWTSLPTPFISAQRLSERTLPLNEIMNFT